MPAEIKHTPGPWHWNGVATIWNTTGQVEEVDREVIVAQVVCDYGSGAHVEPIPVREANARLIAAAPLMLEALKRIRDNCADNDHENWIWRTAQQAITAAQ
jgi:hypothetical protein